MNKTSLKPQEGLSSQPCIQMVRKIWFAEIVPRLPGGAEVDATRQVGEPTISLFPHGISTDVYHIDTGLESFVLRIYPRHDPTRMFGYEEAQTLFTRLGVVTPDTVLNGQNEENYWILERMVAGTSCRELLYKPSVVEQAAVALARLHEHERKRYGKVGAWGGHRLSLRWRQRFRERWSKITVLFPELWEVSLQVEKWFGDWADSYTPRRYQLLHGDYHPGNLIYTDQGEIVFLDFRSPRYGYGLIELLEAAHTFCGEDPKDWAGFVPTYLHCRGEETRLLYSKFETSLHAVFHLRQADRFSSLAVGHRGGLGERRQWERNALDSWLRFTELTGIVAPPLMGQRESAFMNLGARPRATLQDAMECVPPSARQHLFNQLPPTS